MAKDKLTDEELALQREINDTPNHPLRRKPSEQAIEEYIHRAEARAQSEQSDDGKELKELEKPGAKAKTRASETPGEKR